jgi:type IV pilus assembly protein PilB
MVRITRMTRKRLGELLCDESLITEEQVQEALASQRKTGELLGEVLVRLGYVTEYDIAKTIVTQFGLPYIGIKQYFISDEAMKLFPERLMRQYQFLPLDKIGNVISIAVGGLLNFDVLGELEKSSGSHIQVFVSTWSEIKTTIEEFFKSSGGASTGEETDTALSEMELLTQSPSEEVEAPAPAAVAGAGEAPSADDRKNEDLTELGNLLLGDMDMGESGSGGGA